MNLISPAERDVYNQAILDMHHTFSREITVVQELKTPKEPLADNDDDYDFTQNVNAGNQEFNYSYIETTIRARVKYVDKQDKEFALITTLGGEQLNLVQEFGLLRIKVLTESCKLVDESSRVNVDGNNCRVLFRDKPHGLFDNQYCTFYLQRVP